MAAKKTATKKTVTTTKKPAARKPATAKNKKLGKGLDAIFGADISSMIDDIEKNSTSIITIMVPLEDIRPNPYQPRKLFDEEKLQELAHSIKEHGIFQPIILKTINTGI